MVRDSARLAIRPTALHDAPAIQRWAQAPAVARFLFWEAPFPADGARTLTLEAIRLRTEMLAFPFSVFVDRRLAGMVTIDRIDWPAGTGHLFYWLGQPFWSRGIGLWAVDQAMKYAAELRHEGRSLRILFANCLAENEPSLRLLSRSGFREVGQFLGNGDHGGKFTGRKWIRFSRTVNAIPCAHGGRQAVSTSDTSPFVERAWHG